jgi:enoyl-CoA hydratase/carnithine racemase
MGTTGGSAEAQAGRVSYAVADGVATIVFDNPSRANTLTSAMLARLATAWLEAEQDSAVRALVLTASGDRHFCAGVELGMVSDPAQASSALGGFRLTSRDFGVTKPVVAVMNGAAVAAGLGLLADADIIIAARTATFIEPHVRLGQICGPTAFSLARRLPAAQFALMALADVPLTAERAFELGLVTELFDRVEEARSRGTEVALRIAAQSPETVARNLELFRELARDASAEAVRARALEVRETHRSHPDSVEGVAAWKEKRPPRWQSA